MASLGGLISGVMGRAAEGYGKASEMEMKKQSELDLRKQLMEAETEKALRIDEIKRQRDITDEDRKMSPEYLAKVGAADLTRGTIAAGNRTTLAPLTAGAETAEYTAKKPLEDTKATDATGRKITETKTLAGDKDFIKGETLLSEAKKGGDIKVAQIRTAADRPGGSSAVKVRSTYTDDQGQKIAVLSDGSTKVLGKAADYDKTLSNLITKMAKDDFKFAKLPESEKRKQAEERLRGQIVVPSSGRDLSKLSAYERDEKAD
jgi:hypothetical protein